MIIQDEEKFWKSYEVFSEAEIIAVDTETTPIIAGHTPDAIGISLAAKIGDYFIGAYYPFGHRALDSLFGEPNNLPVGYIDKLRPLLEQPNTRYVFHNAKFDLKVLEKVGVTVPNFECTFIYSCMLDENNPHSLESLGERYIGKNTLKHQDPVKKFSKKVEGDFSRIPIEFLGPYAIEDAVVTLKLYYIFRQKLAEQKMEHLLGREMDFLEVLKTMEDRGIGINRTRCEEYGTVSRFRLKEIQDELGFDPAKRTELARHLFLPAPQGLGLPIGEREKGSNEDFPEGKPKAQGPYLRSLLPTLPSDSAKVVEYVLEYRGHHKALSTWFDGFLTKLGPDGRLHPNFKQAGNKWDQGGTRTGRLACSEPNMQQIPRTTEEERNEGISKSLVKNLFEAIPGHVILDFDYSQMELRLAACYAKDQDLLDLFHDNGDMHQLTADKLNISRKLGKDLNFAIQYGAGVNKVISMIQALEPDRVISETEAKDLIQAYWQAYPGMAQVKLDCTMAVGQRGYIRYWTGRRRHFEHKSEAHKAFNSLIQGGCGEIVKQTMIMLHKSYPELRMINQVHDSLWFEVPEKEIDKWEKKIKEVMEWPSNKFGLPFPVGMEILGAK